MNSFIFSMDKKNGHLYIVFDDGDVQITKLNISLKIDWSIMWSCRAAGWGQLGSKLNPGELIKKNEWSEKKNNFISKYYDHLSFINENDQNEDDIELWSNLILFILGLFKIQFQWIWMKRKKIFFFFKFFISIPIIW